MLHDHLRLKSAWTPHATHSTHYFLLGGPAGSIEAGRNVEVSAKLLKDMNIPYIVASPLLLQSIPQWKTNGVLGLQSVAVSINWLVLEFNSAT
jgi:hypothetical protein